jgi:hypothetical protein
MIGCHCATQWHMTTIMKLTVILNNEVPNNGYILGSLNDHDKLDTTSMLKQIWKLFDSNICPFFNVNNILLRWI